MAAASAEDELWLTLSAPDEPPHGLQSTGDPVFNRLRSLPHVPSLTFPVAQGPNGLPLRIQLVDPRPRDLKAHAELALVIGMGLGDQARKANAFILWLGRLTAKIGIATVFGSARKSAAIISNVERGCP